MDFVFPVVDGLAVLTLIADAIIAILLITLFAEAFSKKHFAPSKFVERHALLLMFVVAFVATAGSLFLSEVAGWTPCKYCWIQRIFMYPQVVLLGIALWKRDNKVALYILALSILGMLMAGHHYTEQVEQALNPVPVDELVPCDASGDCARTEINFRYGYITIPMMALTAFVLNALGSITLLRRK